MKLTATVRTFIADIHRAMFRAVVAAYPTTISTFQGYTTFETAEFGAAIGTCLVLAHFTPRIV